MASVIAGFEYDIFISYRQKDNKYDGWVTEFVSNLRKELEATFKEDVTIYFDENPHDGLLESHLVNDSLSGKLKCLVLIPVISQTYCDPACYAWKFEFRNFNRLAKNDIFGRDIRLPNGNVASRILPVKIHDIDAQDKNLFEAEAGFPLRAIEFVYRASGVNRPLKPNDSRSENQNHTLYRDQINKVANSVKDLIAALRQPTVEIDKSEIVKPGMSTTAVGIAAPMKRILVSSFRILRRHTETEFLAFSLPEAIAGSLSAVRDLSVQMDFSGTFYAMSEPEMEQFAIGRKLDVVISGSILELESEVRITINLVELPSLKLLWTTSTQIKVERLFQMHDEIIQKVLVSLKISLSSAEESGRGGLAPRHPGVYPLFLRANQLSLQSNEWERARDLYLQCLAVDAGFAPAWARLARCYRLMGKYAPTMHDCQKNFRLAEEAFDRALAIKPDFAEAHGLMAQLEVDLGKSVASMKRLLMMISSGSNDAFLYAGLVHSFRWVGLLKHSLMADRIAKEIDPSVMTSVGHTYWMMGEYAKASAFTMADIGYIEGVSLAALGDTKKAIAVLAENERKTEKETLKNYLRSLRTALEGDTKESLVNLALAQTPGVDAEALYYLARTYAFLGETEKATELLRTVVEKGFFPASVFQTDPWLHRLRGNANFQMLLDDAMKGVKHAEQVAGRMFQGDTSTLHTVQA